MKILLLNPNSSELVTDALRQAVEPLQTTMLHIDVKHCNNTPKGIVSCFDELKASVEVIDFLLEAEADYDGAIIGCFADPGLRAAREMIRIPVTGLYESSSVFAKLQGRRYSIIASGNEADISPWIGSIRDLGDMEQVASIRYMNSTVEDAVHASDDEICELIRICRKEDGADAVILGCAAFAGRGRRLSELAGISVIDGIEESVLLTKMLTEYGGGKSCITKN